MSKPNSPKNASRSEPDAPLLHAPGRPAGLGGRGAQGAAAKPKNFKGTLGRLWLYLDRERKLCLTVFFLFILLDSAYFGRPLSHRCFD